MKGLEHVIVFYCVCLCLGWERREGASTPCTEQFSKYLLLNIVVVRKVHFLDKVVKVCVCGLFEYFLSYIYKSISFSLPSPFSLKIKIIKYCIFWRTYTHNITGFFYFFLSLIIAMHVFYHLKKIVLWDKYNLNFPSSTSSVCLMSIFREQGSPFLWAVMRRVSLEFVLGATLCISSEKGFNYYVLFKIKGCLRRCK